MSITLNEVLADYQTLPEYVEVSLDSATAVSRFGDRPIHVAATRGSIAELSVLLENGADINASGEEGYRPLHNAVEQGHWAVVAWLLEHGADKSQENDFGDTPLDLSILLDESDIGTLLKRC